MTSFPSETIIVKAGDSYPLDVLAKRYTLPNNSASAGGLTLILMHATGQFKESWEIVLDKISQLSVSQPTLIYDVYSIESPNHGESAVANEEALKIHFHESWPTRTYSKAAHRFLTAGPGNGARVDFSQRRLVGICHSVGAPALCLMRELSPRVKFESVIFFEPGISLKDNPDTNVASQALTAWTWLRRDTWKDAKSAKKELQSSPIHASWDPRALDLYIKYGLRIHPANKFKPPFRFKGVTTALTKEQEAASYRTDELVVDGLEAYGKVTQECPVHVIWGEYNDVATPELQDLLADKTQGRTPASVSHIENAGHLVVQQQPDAVAVKIYQILVALLPLAHL